MLKNKKLSLKLSKENGFTHVGVVILACVVVVGVVGTYMLVRSNAAQVQPEVIATPQAVVSQTPQGGNVSADAASASLRNKIVRILLSQQGVGESPKGSNHIPGNPYHSNNQPWCAYFVSWVWQHAISFPTYSNASQIKQWGINHGHWHTRGSYGPHSGDIAVFQSGVHVAMVSYSNNGQINLIGGNVNDAVRLQTSKTGRYLDWPSNFYVQEVRGGTRYYIDGFVTP